MAGIIAGRRPDSNTPHVPFKAGIPPLYAVRTVLVYMKASCLAVRATDLPSSSEHVCMIYRALLHQSLRSSWQEQHPWPSQSSRSSKDPYRFPDFLLFPAAVTAHFAEAIPAPPHSSLWGCSSGNEL